MHIRIFKVNFPSELKVWEIYIFLFSARNYNFLIPLVQKKNSPKKIVCLLLKYNPKEYYQKLFITKFYRIKIISLVFSEKIRL